MNIKLLKNLDALFGILLIRLLKEPRPGPIPEIKNILVIRPGGIGDAVLLIPAINSLKDKFPEAKITILAEKRNGAVFSLCTGICRILLYDGPRELFAAIRDNYDVVIDAEQWHRLSAVVSRLTKAQIIIGFATNERKRLFTHSIPYSHDDYETDSFFRLLAPLGISTPEDTDQPFLTVPKGAIDNTRTLLGGFVEKQFVTLFPGASIPERRWGAVSFGELAERLHRIGFSVVVVGGSGDEAEGDRIVSGNSGLNLAGKTTLVGTAAVIDKSILLISGDSGILHIGVGLGKPSVSLFGPGIAKKWAPRGDRHIVINKHLSCSPCTKFGYTPHCSINAQCMAEITVDEVFEAVEKLLKMQKIIDNDDGKLL